MVRYLLFDFDGTLADSKEASLKAINRLADRHNFKKLQPEMLAELRQLSILERCRILGCPVYKIPFLAAEFYQLYKNSLPEVRLFPGIKELLQNLHQSGYELGIVSSNSAKNIRLFLQTHNLTFITQVLSSNRIFGKDAMLQKFLKTNRLLPQDILYIGDEVRDLEACRKCGIKMVWVSWGFDAYELIAPQNPDFIADDPNALTRVILENFALPPIVKA